MNWFSSIRLVWKAEKSRDKDKNKEKGESEGEAKTACRWKTEQDHKNNCNKETRGQTESERQQPDKYLCSPVITWCGSASARHHPATNTEPAFKQLSPLLTFLCSLFSQSEQTLMFFPIIGSRSWTPPTFSFSVYLFLLFLFLQRWIVGAGSKAGSDRPVWPPQRGVGRWRGPSCCTRPHPDERHRWGPRRPRRPDPTPHHHHQPTLHERSVAKVSERSLPVRQSAATDSLLFPSFFFFFVFISSLPCSLHSLDHRRLAEQEHTR